MRLDATLWSFTILILQVVTYLSYILFLFEKLIPDVAQIFNKLRATYKKSKIELADLEVILEILES
jgi:hypothetical protein